MLLHEGSQSRSPHLSAGPYGLLTCSPPQCVMPQQSYKPVPTLLGELSGSPWGLLIHSMFQVCCLKRLVVPSLHHEVTARPSHLQKGMEPVCPPYSPHLCLGSINLFGSFTVRIKELPMKHLQQQQGLFYSSQKLGSSTCPVLNPHPIPGLDPESSAEGDGARRGEWRRGGSRRSPDDAQHCFTQAGLHSCEIS